LLASASGMLRMAARGYRSALRDLMNRLKVEKHATANA